MNILTTILLVIIGVFMFGFVVFFHELGHFITARLCKVRVNEFAVGMGPKIFSRKKGETRYSLRLFPIGGYCAMEGEDEESTDEHAFGSRPVWQRMIVIVAGGFMNILLGFIILLIMTSMQDRFASTTVAQVTEGSTLAAAGVQEGDEITRIDDYAVYSDRDLLFALALADPEQVDFEVKREGEKMTFRDIDIAGEEDADGNKTFLMDFKVYPQEKTFFTTVKRSGVETLSMVRMVVESLKGILTGRFGLNDMAGPVGTAQVITQAASEGLKSGFGDAVGNIMTIIVLITVNLGVVNLLPIPALDGGRFLFLLVELIFRKPIPTKYEGWVHTAGFVLIIGLMLVVTFNDIVRIVTGG